MIKKQISNPILLFLLSFISLTGTFAQAQSLKLNPKTFSMTIFGTTNVHNFQSKVTQASGDLVVNTSKQIQSLEVGIPVKSIKSNEKLMDKKTYEAFNETKNPTITFRMLEVNSLQVTGDDINVTITGNLTMAGTTKKVILKSTGKITKPGVYEFKGSIALKMTEYGMKPPTAMLGVMKVGDAITLKYDVTFEGASIN
jgi:polyisoprenoid-binding protein YceI